MAEKRKDPKGRILRSGEYYDQKNKRYMYRKMVSGERITITASDLAGLRQQENEILRHIDKGGSINARTSRMTLNEYFDFWLETFAKSSRKATTCTNYASYYKTYIRDTIGNNQIAKITKVECQKIFNQMSVKGLQHSTMTNLKSCLNQMFECALDDDIITRNPVKNIKLPQTKAKKRTAVDLRQLELFLEYVKNNPRYVYAYPALVVLFNVGMRIGELAALTADDFDPENDTLAINKSVNRYRKSAYGFTAAVASTKTESSDRVVLVNDITRKMILRCKLQNASSAVGMPLVDDYGKVRGKVSGFLFLNSHGKVWTEPTFLSMIGRIIERYNLDAQKTGREMIDDFCPHMARHTFTTAAYSAGVDIKVVSEMLGHASTKVTLDTYTHLSKEKEKEQRAAVRSIHIS